MKTNYDLLRKYIALNSSILPLQNFAQDLMNITQKKLNLYSEPLAGGCISPKNKLGKKYEEFVERIYDFIDEKEAALEEITGETLKAKFRLDSIAETGKIPHKKSQKK